MGFLSRSRRIDPAMTDSVGAPASPIDGQWDHSDQPAIAAVRGDLFTGTSGEACNPDSSDTGLAAIVAHDPHFDKAHFLDGVQSVFYVVEGAWTQRQPEVSRQVMADGLWQQHRVQIQTYIDTGKRNVLEGLALISQTIIAAHSDSNFDTICVRMLATCADYDVKDSNGKIVRGNRDVDEWMEDWTFQRSSSATTPVKGGTLSHLCPNCGAPLELDLTGRCKYCKALVSSGDFDWVLSRISKVPRAVE
jgi:predicted lipid-binding transport protein (Tim44 family)